MQPALIIIAKEGYQDHEYEGTRQGLEEAGFEIVVASTEAGECHGKFGGMEIADEALEHIDVDGFDRVAFIGGPGAFAFASDSEALRIAHETAFKQKPLGAICIAPTVLAKAKVLGGKKATVFPGAENIELLEQYGASYTGDPVTVDGNIVTGNGPDAAEEFGKTFATIQNI